MLYGRIISALFLLFVVIQVKCSSIPVNYNSNADRNLHYNQKIHDWNDRNINNRHNANQYSGVSPRFWGWGGLDYGYGYDMYGYGMNGYWG